MEVSHLHIHSEFSLLDSTCRIDSLVQQAKNLGVKSIAITDTNVLYGVIPFYKACKKANIHPVIGLTVHMPPLLTPTSDKKEIVSLRMLAKTNTGYQNLVKLSSILQLSRDQSLNTEQLAAHAEGLIVLSGGVHGEIEHALIKGDKTNAHKLARFFKKSFGSDFYLELQRVGQPNDENRIHLQRELGKELGIETVATHPVHYLHSHEALAYRSLSCIRLGLTMEESYLKEREGDAYLKSPEEMLELFSDDPDALKRTNEIANQCEVMFDFNQTYLPKFPTPVGVQPKDYLSSLCQKGILKRYGEMDLEVKQRLDYELTIIDQMGFNDYFLVIWDVIRFARTEGIHPGPGRGSAAGSIVSYSLGITDVDPLKHDLLFERFLNPERVTMPDIDIDFPDNRRDEILHYVQKRYGKDRVAQIGTFGTLSAKAALRDLGRVLAMKPRDLDPLVAQIPSTHGITLEGAYQQSSKLRQLISGSESYRTLYSLARLIEGLPRHTSIHAAGVIINSFPLTELVPLQEGRDGLSVTQFPMEVLESLGLIKMDFLGLRNLTLIDQIEVNIKKEGLTPPNLQQLSFDDQATFDMLKKGETDGVFQLESSGMRDVLKRLKPTSFEDIVAVCALYRPGPMQNIPSYIEGKHGKRAIDYLHPDLEPILAPTFGVIVYQEQIMRIASVMAGFSLGEADILRRAVAKKKREILEQEKSHFLKGALSKGYDEQAALKVYEWIVRFADYGFNRSHAVAYAVIAYQLAYLKAHYLGPFITALLSSVGHHPEKMTEYMALLQKKGLKLLLPSVNKSDLNFSSEPNGVRFGLGAIKNVGIPAVKEIQEVRKKGDFKSFQDFCTRISMGKLSRRTIEALIMAGAMDEFGYDRAQMLASIDPVLERAQEMRRAEENGQTTFKYENEDREIPVEVVPPFRFEERLAMEKEVLGFYISGHPTSPFREVASSWGAVAIQDLKLREKSRLSVLMEAIKIIKTKKGQQMAFGRCSDGSGQIEVVLFPNVFEAYRDCLQEGELLFVEGVLEKKKGMDEEQFILEKARRLNQLKVVKQKKPEAQETALYLRIQGHAYETLNKVKEWLLQNPGNSRVYIYDEVRDQTRLLSENYSASGDEKTLLFLKQLLGERNVIIK